MGKVAMEKEGGARVTERARAPGMDAVCRNPSERASTAAVRCSIHMDVVISKGKGKGGDRDRDDVGSASDARCSMRVLLRVARWGLLLPRVDADGMVVQFAVRRSPFGGAVPCHAAGAGDSSADASSDRSSYVRRTCRGDDVQPECHAHRRAPSFPLDANADAVRPGIALRTTGSDSALSGSVRGGELDQDGDVDGMGRDRQVYVHGLWR